MAPDCPAAQGAKYADDPVVLWLLVAYGNMPEVDAYIDHLDMLTGRDGAFRYAVCDNSPHTSRSKHVGRSDVAFTARPDNPGYLDGGLAALEKAREMGWSEANWISLSNTDLRWLTADLVNALSAYPHRQAMVIAPRITEGEARVEKNPHVLVRRPLRRHRFNALVAARPITMMAYQMAAILRIRLGAGEQAPRMDSRAWAARFPSGVRFYSPYGAVMFFSSGFRPFEVLPRGVPLQAEEYFIAEAADAQNAPVIYLPELHAHHDGHTTTGPRLSWRRTTLMKDAFRAIENHARVARNV